MLDDAHNVDRHALGLVIETAQLGLHDRRIGNGLKCSTHALIRPLPNLAD
jgi:hypothetical protein